MAQIEDFDYILTCTTHMSQQKEYSYIEMKLKELIKEELGGSQTLY